MITRPPTAMQITSDGIQLADCFKTSATEIAAFS
jgi:hypothetical protein